MFPAPIFSRTCMLIALQCLKDRDGERPTAAHICLIRDLEQWKAAQDYTCTTNEAENTNSSLEQQLRLKEKKKVTETDKLQE